MRVEKWKRKDRENEGRQYVEVEVRGEHKR